MFKANPFSSSLSFFPLLSICLKCVQVRSWDSPGLPSPSPPVGSLSLSWFVWWISRDSVFPSVFPRILLWSSLQPFLASNRCRPSPEMDLKGSFWWLLSPASDRSSRVSSQTGFSGSFSSLSPPHPVLKVSCLLVLRNDVLLDSVCEWTFFFFFSPSPWSFLLETVLPTQKPTQISSLKTVSVALFVAPL